MKIIFCMAMLLSLSIHGLAQDQKESPDSSEYYFNHKINELNMAIRGLGYDLQREQMLSSDKREVLVINTPLKYGQKYHFVIVGEPQSDKLKATLSKGSVSEFFSKSVQANKDSVYWMEFSFTCPMSGIYTLDLQQQGKKSKSSTYLALWAKRMDE